jgi:hypothetical protein
VSAVAAGDLIRFAHPFGAALRAVDVRFTPIGVSAP